MRGRAGAASRRGGFAIEAPFGLSDLREADTVIVPAWRDPDEVPPKALLDALRQSYRRGARVASLRMGAFVLPHAGLLDGRRAATHWVHADALAGKFPAVEVDADVLYVDEGRVLTSAGTAAGIDLCLHMVRRDHGAKVANGFARRMVVSPHREGGQSQYVRAPVAERPGGGPLEETLEWALTNLAEPLTVARLSAHARMSERTFARRFREVTGTTPLRWLLGQRILAAQSRLEASGDPVDRIARDCGFGTGATLRLHFKRAVGVSPITAGRSGGNTNTTRLEVGAPPGPDYCRSSRIPGDPSRGRGWPLRGELQWCLLDNGARYINKGENSQAWSGEQRACGVGHRYFAPRAFGSPQYRWRGK